MTDLATDLPGDVRAWLGCPRHEERGDVPVERGAIWTALGATENGNPLFWDDATSGRLTGGPVAPPTMLSAWFRPHPWAPNRASPHLPLQVHFDLKDRLGLPEAVISDNAVVFHRPLRPGDVVATRQVLRSVSGEKQTRLGTGRFWTIDVEVSTAAGELAGVETYTGFGYRRREPVCGPADVLAAGGAPSAEASRAPAGQPPEQAPGVTPADQPPGLTPAGQLPGVARGGQASAATVVPHPPDGAPWRLLHQVAAGHRLPAIAHRVTTTTVVLGALASRDWRPMHHDRDFAVTHNGTPDVFLNAPSQAAWMERLVTDWSGPHGRLGRLSFQMRSPVFPGDAMVLRGTVDEVGVDGRGCGWVTISVGIEVDGEVRSAGRASVALPVGPRDNPWARHGDDWAP